MSFFSVVVFGEYPDMKLVYRSKEDAQKAIRKHIEKNGRPNASMIRIYEYATRAEADKAAITDTKCDGVLSVHVVMD